MNIADAKILIVEDDELMRAFIVHTLKRLGVKHFQECADGTAALLANTVFRPDLILTDIHMNPMGGVEFVARLRKTTGVARGPKVIFMSVDQSMETLGAAMPLDVVAYIVKPPRLAELKNKIELALTSG